MIVVIGGGPAGMSAALEIAKSGVEVTLLDAAPRLGGQYWRHLPDAWVRPSGAKYLYDQVKIFIGAIKESSHITYLGGAHVWSASNTGDGICINYLKDNAEKSLVAQKIVIATGAYDWALPFPGWDIPGVMTPGAAQALLKGSGVVVGKKIVVGGTGPFLLPVSLGLIGAGAHVVGIFEANSPSKWITSLRAMILNSSKIWEGKYFLTKLRKEGAPLHFGKVIIAASPGSDGNLRSVTVAKINRNSSLRKGSEKIIECDVAAIGWGFVPDLSIAGALGCAQKVDCDGTVIACVDEKQLSSNPRVWIVGELTGIGGHELSLVEGAIAGQAITGGAIDPALIKVRKRLQIFARALQRSYPVPQSWHNWLTEDTTICRCEEVTYCDIRESVSALGAMDARTSKLFTRAGMGLCQGRMCTRNVSEIVAQLRATQVSDAERISSSNRPTAAPISLGALSDGEKG